MSYTPCFQILDKPVCGILLEYGINFSCITPRTSIYLWLRNYFALVKNWSLVLFLLDNLFLQSRLNLWLLLLIKSLRCATSFMNCWFFCIDTIVGFFAR